MGDPIELNEGNRSRKIKERTVGDLKGFICFCKIKEAPNPIGRLLPTTSQAIAPTLSGSLVIA